MGYNTETIAKDIGSEVLVENNLSRISVQCRTVVNVVLTSGGPVKAREF